MNLKQMRAAALKAAQDIIEKAKSEGRAMTEDEVTQVEAKKAEIEDLDKKIKAAEEGDALMAKMSQLGAPVGEAEDGGPIQYGTETLGDHFVKSAGKRLAQVKDDGGRWSVSAPEFKASTDPQTRPSALDPATTQVDTNLVTGVRRRLTIADLVASGTLTSSAITYFVEGSLEGDAGSTAEGATKNQVHSGDPTAVTESLTKLTAFLKESDEMIEDLPFLVSAINNRLLYRLGVVEEDQILDGNGSGANLKGILQRTGVQTEAATTKVLGADNADAIFRGMTKVQTGSGLAADGIVMHPTDYQKLRLSKDGNGQYFGGGYFAGEYGNGGIQVQPPVWGLRTVVTSAVDSGTVVVGAFRQAATLYRKGGVRVESTNSDKDDFQKNMVTIRAEERLALAVRIPAGFVKVTLDYQAKA